MAYGGRFARFTYGYGCVAEVLTGLLGQGARTHCPGCGNSPECGILTASGIDVIRKSEVSCSCARRVTPGVRHPTSMADVTVAESEIHGLGVFATRDFAEGEIILPIDDSRVVDDEHPLRPEAGEYGYHCDYLAGGKTVLMRPPERHINSCCDPNAYVKTISGVRHVAARRSIKSGEEITCDYIIDCHGGIVWQCGCGSPRCRGTIVSSFFELPVESQLEYLPLLNEWFIGEHREEIEALRRRAADAQQRPAPGRD